MYSRIFQNKNLFNDRFNQFGVEFFLEKRIENEFIKIKINL